MSFETLKLDHQDGIWTLTVSRPESLNALNSQVLTELEKALGDIAAKTPAECRALIITGSGNKAFVAGADIKEMSDLNPDQALQFAERGQRVFRKIEELSVPVIAAVNGFALGGGLELALACDFIIASENAKLGLPEVTLGLLPGFGGTVRLSRVVGLSRAREMIFGGEMLTAQEALNCGLVNHVLIPEELLAFCFKKAATIASRGPVALANAKRSVLKTWDQDVTTALKTEAKEFAQLFSTADMREGTQAFIQKRKAAFKGN